jgi:hypothetical protein
MKKTMFALATIYLLWAAVVAALTGEVATTFTGVIIGIDHGQRTITFQTMDGQTWALGVFNSNVLMQDQVATGDPVRLEIDLSGTITKITKISEHPLAQPTQFLEEVRP